MIPALTYEEQLDLRSDRDALAWCISEIRTVTALPDVPIAELPGMIETLLSELADRQIQSDVEELIGDGSGEFLPPVSDMPRIANGIATMDPEDDEWEPEDTVVPAYPKSCRGCLRLTEIDGRLMCVESRSRTYGASLHWPGPGCVWASAGDAIYGGVRG